MSRWKQTVGEPGHRVTVSERADRGGLLTLTWYERGQPKSRSLGLRLRDARGRVDPAVASQALARAAAQADRLEQGGRGGLTLGETEARVFDPATGLYPSRESPHHREVLRSLRYAVAVWGPEQPWAEIRYADLRALWRQKIHDLRKAGHQGVRGAEVVIARLLAIAHWLQGEELIPAEAASASRHWKRELRRDWKQITGQAADPEPHRPRHKVEEMNRIIAVAPRVDPRFALMLQLGAELRLGMVRRLLRSHVHVSALTVRVPDSGHKRGVKVFLTAEQARAVDQALGEGYLAALERRRTAGEIDDYPLFPSGRLTGWKAEGGAKVRGRRRGYRMVPGQLVAHRTAAPVSRTAVRDWFREAEQLAGVPHRRGRGTYGMRRAATQGAKDAGADRDALKEFGGWTDTQMPDRVYAEAEQDQAGQRARDIREKVRARR